MHRRRIAVTQRVVELAERAERRDALDQRWVDFAATVGASLFPLPNRADPVDFIEAVGPDLVILSGGNDLVACPEPSDPAPERDALEAALIDLCLAESVPLLGVCRGMQMIVHHLGGTVQRVGGHAGTRHEVSFAAESRWPMPARRTVNSFHHWGPADDPEYWPVDLEVLGRAGDRTIEAIAHRTRPMVGVMWHPERPPHDDHDRALVHALIERR